MIEREVGTRRESLVGWIGRKKESVFVEQIKQILIDFTDKDASSLGSFRNIVGQIEIVPVFPDKV